MVGVEAIGEDVGPGGVGAAGAAPAVGDAVAEGYDGGAFGIFDFNVFEEAPGGGLGGVGERVGGELIAAGLEAGLEGEAVLGEGSNLLGGDVEGEGEVGECGEIEGDGVADGDGSGRDGDGGMAVEGESYGGGGLDGAVRLCGVGGERGLCAADDEGIGA